MAISTNGAIITRVTSALYGEYLSNASYTEVKDTAPATVAANFLANDFAGKTDLQVANTILTNLGLTSITGLNNWLSAQLTAAGSTAAAKGAKLVSILNDYANLTSDATYGSYATSFNAKVAAGLVQSQTAGSKGGAFATADAVAVTNGTFTLTDGLDNGSAFTGGAGNDTFTAVTSSVSGDTTLTTGDSLVGGAGTDTLLVSVAGSAAATALAATSGVEVLSVFNNSSAALTVDATLMAGLSTVRVTSGTNTTSVTNLDSLPSVELVSTSQNATVGTIATVGTGEADSVAVSVNGVATAANTTLTYNGPETIALTATGAATGSSSKSLTITDSDLETLTISGSANVNVTTTFSGAALSTQTGTLNASAAGGVVRANVTAGASGKLAVTGSAQNDVITLGAGSATKYMTVDGGAGTDTLSVSSATYDTTTGAVQPGANVTNFETLAVTGGGTVDLRAFPANTFTAATAAAGATLSKANAGLATVTLTADGSLTHTLATDTAADALTVSLANTTGGVTVAALSAADIETLTITSGGISSNVVTALTDTDLTKLVVTGTQDFSVTNALTDATSLATVDASGLTGLDTVFSLDASASTKAMTVTLGAGVEGTAGGTVNTITTGYGADSVTGGAYKDVITTGSGNDTVTAGAGNDVISTGLGDDSVDGGTGDDSINGGAGNDVLAGGDGNDTIDGSTGNDTITGGAGNDKIYIAALTDDSNISDSAGTDTLSKGTTSSTLAASFYTAVTDSAAPTITGVETGYVQITTTGSNTSTAPLIFDMTKVTGMTSLYLNTVDTGANNNEYVTVKNFGGSTITLTELSGSDIGFLTLDGIGQASLTVNARGYAVGTSTDDLIFTGVNAVTVNGTSYVSTSPQTNSVGDVIAASANAITISTSGNTTASNANALTANSVTAANATSVTLSPGQNDTLTVTGDVVTTNSLVDTLNVTLADDSTLTITGADIDLKSSPVLNATITVGTGATVSTVNVDAASISNLTMTLGAASTTTLDLDAAITKGTVTMSSGSTWTLDTAGAAGSASSLTISGRGDVVEGTTIDLAGTNFTFDAGSLIDADGLVVTAAALTGKLTATGTSGADGITGSALADTISGGLGADTITGSAGNDSLTGGSGADVFNYASTVLTDGTDVITDFGSSDYIAIDAATTLNTYFEGAIGSVANTDEIVVLTAASYASATAIYAAGTFSAASSTVIVYLDSATTTAKVYYDADGETGGADGVVIAELTGITSLTLLAAAFADGSITLS